MPQNYVPIFIFIAFVGILIPITLLAAKLVRPDNPSKTKLMPYECGIDPVDTSRGRYTVRYYIVAILFVVFDVETIFLFPWAVQFKALGVFGLIEMLVFIFDTTVRRRDWDSDAVFKPSPNLPRSPSDRTASGPTPPNLMASTRVSSAMP